jgi:hypothetical protein
MKNSLLALSIGVTLVCILLVVRTNQDLASARARATVAERHRASLLESEGQRQLPARLGGDEAGPLEKRTSPEVIPASKIPANDPAARSSLSAIFRDAAMQEMLKDEARVGAARNVKALFNAGLARQLNLTEEQSTKLRALLLEKASLFWERMLLPMMTGELDDAGMATAGQSLRGHFEANTAELKALLGDEGYNLYQWYEKTQPDRDQARRFIPEFERAGQALSAEQQAQLLGIMTDERANFQFSFDPGDPSRLDLEHWYDNFSHDKIETFGAELQQLNERVVQRASAVLSQEQASLLQSLLHRQLQKGRLTMLTTTAAIGKAR